MNEVFIQIASGLAILLGMVHLASTKMALREVTGLVIGQLPHDRHAVGWCWLHAFIPGGGAAGTGALRGVCRNMRKGSRNLRSSIGCSAHGDLFCVLLADEEPNRQGRVVRLPDHRPVLRPGNVPLI